MSAYGKDYAPWWAVVAVAFMMFIAVTIMTTEYRSQLRDLQRRVGQLEQQRVRFCVDCPNWK